MDNIYELLKVTNNVLESIYFAIMALVVGSYLKRLNTLAGKKYTKLFAYISQCLMLFLMVLAILNFIFR